MQENTSKVFNKLGVIPFEMKGHSVAQVYSMSIFLQTTSLQPKSVKQERNIYKLLKTTKHYFTTSPLHKLATIFLVLLLMIILAIITNLKVIYSSIQIACLFWNCLFSVAYLHNSANDNSQANKVSLQNQLQYKTTTLLNKINITTYFENLTVELHVLYALNIHVKFCVNRILFTT